MTHSPSNASGDQPPAGTGLTARDLAARHMAARLAAEGDLNAEDIAALARLDNDPGADGDSWDDDPSSDPYGDPWDNDPGPSAYCDPSYDQPGLGARAPRCYDQPGLGARASRVAEVWDAGFTHHVPGEPGCGFASGGVLDRMLPGRELAAFTGTGLRDGLERLSDYELIGFLCAARRNTSWQQAAELAAVANLDRRRAAADGTPGEHVADEVAAALKLSPRAADGLLALAAGIARLSQVPAALAAGLIDRSRAEVFVRELLPLNDEMAVRVEAMVMPRAPDMTTGQLAHALQQAVAAVDPAAAERRQKRSEQDARVEVWMEPGRGTAAVAGRDLPAADVIAADKRLTAAARWLKARGANGTMDWLRSRAYLAFMNGYSLDDLLAGLLAQGQDCDTSGEPTGTDRAAARGQHNGGSGGASSDDAPGSAEQASADDTADGHRSGREHTDDHGAICGDGDGDGAVCADGDGNDSTAPIYDADAYHGAGRPAGGVQVPAELANPAAPPGLAALAGGVNLTMPAQTWLGLSDVPGEAGGFGALDAGTCRDLAAALAANPATRWCVTLVSPDGRPVAHGCARAGPGPPGSGKPNTGNPDNNNPDNGNPGSGNPAAWLATVEITPIEAGVCEHRRESAGYQPSNLLRHVIKVRSRRCGFPGCRRPAVSCDDDHTVPYDKGGRTCECNLHPLCRRHHQAKQAPGWHLEQPEPGTLIWTLPSGRAYPVTPEPYQV